MISHIEIERFLHFVVKELCKLDSEAYLVKDKAAWTELLTKAVGKAIEHPKVTYGSQRAVHRWQPDQWGKKEYYHLDVSSYDPDNLWADSPIIVELENTCTIFQVQKDVSKMLGICTDCRVLYTYFGRGTQFKNFDHLRQVVENVYKAHPGKNLILCAGEWDPAPLKSNDDLMDYFETHVFGRQ